MSLATKYRPHEWDSVVGQENIMLILKKQLSDRSFKNCYIFSGTSGSGKTTIARIFANEINNHQGSPIEIDAASNNGVDNVRVISESAKERSLDSEYKIYIIDEAHMLTTAAWNAMLKTIEEPPKYTLFIFCTTDPQKIPGTIKNRCMRFNFTRIPAMQISERLKYICRNENYTNYEDACDYISRICKGELRNAISILETSADYSTDLSVENVLSTTGTYSYKNMFDLVNAIIDGDVSKSIQFIDTAYHNGIDLKHFVDLFIDFIIDCDMYCLCQDITVTKLPLSYEEDLKFATGISDASKYYLYFGDKLLELKNMLKQDDNPLNTIKLVITQMCRLI